MFGIEYAAISLVAAIDSWSHIAGDYTILSKLRKAERSPRKPAVSACPEHSPTLNFPVARLQFAFKRELAEILAMN